MTAAKININNDRAVTVTVNSVSLTLYKIKKKKEMAAFLPNLSGLAWKSTNLAGYGVIIYLCAH